MFTTKELRLSPFLLILGLFLGAGCGVDKDYRSSPLSFRANLEDGSPLDDGEMGVALRICYAYRSKRAKFFNELINSPFSFNYSQTNCSATVTESRLDTTLRQVVADGPMSFEAPAFTLSYAREVQTDLHGELVSICNQVLKGETPLDFIEVDGVYSEYIFESGLYDRVTIKKAMQKISDGPVEVISSHSFDILTNQSSAGDYLGLVVKTNQFFPCEDSPNVKTITQEFIEP